MSIAAAPSGDAVTSAAATLAPSQLVVIGTSLAIGSVLTTIVFACCRNKSVDHRHQCVSLSGMAPKAKPKATPTKSKAKSEKKTLLKSEDADEEEGEEEAESSIA